MTTLVPNVTISAFVSYGYNGYLSYEGYHWSSVATVARNRQRCFALRTFLTMFNAKASGTYVCTRCVTCLSIRHEKVKYEFIPASTAYYWFHR